MKEDIYRYFKEISSIPRETYHIEDISNYLVKFAKERNLEVYQDHYKNVMIKKAASSGYEERDPVILQAHMDMVCQKEKDSNHDFRKDGIEILERDGYLTANKTTLGADDGIGIAMILALLDGDYQHPPLEILFTADEEVGMDGAYQVDMNWFESNKLINLDSEEEGILTAGCAGGIQLEVSLPIIKEEQTGQIITIEISNLLGGHSGVDIDKNRANAVKFIMNYMKDSYHIISIDGGKVDNAIMDSASIKILSKEKINVLKLEKNIKNTLYQLQEYNAKVSVTSKEGTTEVFKEKYSNNIISYLKKVKNGVISYEEELPDKVQASLNLGIISTHDNQVTIRHLIRSSNEKKKVEIVSHIKDLAHKNSFSFHEINSFPGWEYQKKSQLRDLLKKEYKNMFHKELEIDVTHAGLECGILVSKKSSLDCVSIGPNIMDAHTPKERVEIESVNRTFDYLLSVLKNMI